MNRYIFVLFPFWGLFMTGLLLAAEGPVKTGIVKGSVTRDGRPAPDVVVSVEGLSREWVRAQVSPKPGVAVMDQRQIKFVPRIMPVLKGTTVEFPNSDKVWHNVFSTSKPNEFDLGLYPPGKTGRVTFDEPGVVRILCNAHPAMEAFIVVKEHPYFTVSDNRGNYRLEGIPPGQYHIRVWHPELGVVEEPFNLVREGEILAVDVQLR